MHTPKSRQKSCLEGLVKNGHKVAQKTIIADFLVACRSAVRFCELQKNRKKL